MSEDFKIAIDSSNEIFYTAADSETTVSGWTIVDVGSGETIINVFWPIFNRLYVITSDDRICVSTNQGAYFEQVFASHRWIAKVVFFGLKLKFRFLSIYRKRQCLRLFTK